jgi:hypothetical protein
VSLPKKLAGYGTYMRRARDLDKAVIANYFSMQFILDL